MQVVGQQRGDEVGAARGEPDAVGAAVLADVAAGDVAGLDQAVDEPGHGGPGDAGLVGELGGSQALVAGLVELDEDVPAAARQAVRLVVLLERGVELPVEVQERDARRDGVPVEAGDGPRELLDLLEAGAGR